MNQLKPKKADFNCFLNDFGIQNEITKMIFGILKANKSMSSSLEFKSLG